MQLDLSDAQEAAAIAIAEQWTDLKPQGSHGQRCPVYTHQRPQAECDCWILPRARRDALAAILAAAPIIREQIAREIEAYQPIAHMAVCPPEIAWEAGRETAARIARGGVR